MLTVAILGAGPLGRSLALAGARAGLRVLLEDVMPASLRHAQEYIRRQLSPSALAAQGAQIAFVSSIEDAVRDADLAVDCVPDELESKLEILWLLDRMAPPRTVFATPTTRLSIADLAACTYRADKCVAIVAEAWELARGSASTIRIRTTARTSIKTVTMVREFWNHLSMEACFEVEPELQPPAAAAPSPHAG